MKNNYSSHLGHYIAKLLSFIIFFTGLSTIEAKAQNDIRVNVQVLPPYSTQLHDYIGNEEELARRFQEQVLVTLQNNSASETHEVKLITSVESNNGVFAGVNPNFQPFQPIILGPGEMRVLSGSELSDINRNLTRSDVDYGGISRDQIVRTGTLPEGSYQVCVRALDYNSNQPLSLDAPMGCSPSILIAFPDPPVIAYPFADAEVIATEPQALNISWAPSPNLSSDVKYRLRIVELNDINANPYDLMEQTNISFFERGNLSTTNYFYDQTNPPLKVGYTYAIRLQAYDPFGQLQIKNNGLSEIHIFKYVEQTSSGETLADIDYIGLVPGILHLINLENLNVTDQGDFYTYNGEAQVKLTNPVDGTSDILQVRVQNLQVDKGNFANPLIRAGNVSASINQNPQSLNELDDLVKVNSVTWDADQGIGIAGEIIGPDNKSYDAQGNLQLTQSGMYGSIKAEGSLENPLFQFGTNPAIFSITGLGIEFPSLCQSYQGSLKLFNRQNENEQIPVEATSCQEEQNALNINASQTVTMGIDAGVGKFQLKTKNIYGTITPNWNDQSLAYDLNLLSEVGFENHQNSFCGKNLLLQLSSAQGISIEEVGNSCGASSNTIPLGPAVFEYSNFTIDNLSYNPLSEDWDFELSLDGQFSFPVFGFTTPRFQDITVNKSGIRIPAMNYNNAQLTALQPVDWENFIFTLEDFQQSPVTLPIFEVEKIGPGDWDFSLTAKATFSDDYNVPACLRGASLDFTGVTFDHNQDGTHLLNGVLEANDIGNCTWEFGAGYAFNFNSLDGTVAMQLDENQYFHQETNLKLDFDFLFGEPFACENTEQIEMLDTELSLKNGVTGVVEDLVPDCPLKVGPFTASIVKSSLSLEFSSQFGQQAYLQGQAELDYKNLSTLGTFTLDLMTGEFSDLSFKIDEPFILDLPTEETVLSFRIQEAEINKNGFLIDGRNELLLSGQNINATFDQLLLELSSKKIKSGQVIFDSNFAFEASIDQNQNLAFKAVPADHSFTASPALFMQLAGAIKIDSAGIKANGEANALINFSNIHSDTLTAIYENDFAIGFYPFQINQGRVDFFHQQQRVAIADASGIHFDMASIGKALIPEKIPLPTEQVAYLLVKDGDNLLVNSEEKENGQVVISTKPGQPVKLVIPALQGNRATAPEISTYFNDLTLESSNGQLVSGSVVAAVPENDPAFDLSHLGVPINPTQVAYGVNSEGGVNLTSFFVRGSLNVLDQDLGEKGIVVAGIQSDKRIRANVNLNNIKVEKPIDQFSDKIKLVIENVQGSMDIPLDNTLADGDYSFDIDSKFEIINNSNETVASAGFSARVEPDRFTLLSAQGELNEQNATIDLEHFQIKLNEIKSLSFDYTRQNGFDFMAELDTEFIMKLNNGENFTFPLKNIEINNQGFFFPAQQINESTVNDFQVPTIGFGIFHLTPLAFRMRETRFNWFTYTTNDVLNLLPKVDLELSFTDDAQLFNTYDLSQASVTVNDVGIEDGILTGQLESYYFPTGGANLALSPQIGLNVSKISGALVANPDLSQGFAVDLTGVLKYAELFTKQQVCNQTEVTVGINQQAHLEGVIENFTPCGKYENDPLTLEFNSSKLLFAYADELQKATLSGSATATVKRSSGSPITANGQVDMDLISGKLIDGEILLTGPFTWDYPQQAPMFSFTVQTAKLDTSGLVFNGNGSLKVGGGNSTIQYQDLTFSLQDGSLKDGSANIDNSFALDINFSNNRWLLEDPDVDPAINPGLRLVMPPKLTINKNGLFVNETGTASLYVQDSTIDLLSVDFNNFNIGFEPVGVKDGVADMIFNQEKVAYYDKTGFNWASATNLAKSLIPDTLGLPTRDVAYIVLRDPNTKQLLVQIDNNELNTSSPVDLVITSLDKDNPIKVSTTLQQVKVNDAYQVVSGSIQADFENNPIDLSPYGDMPLELQMVKFEKLQNKPYALYAKAKLKLPASLNDVEVNIEHIKFGPNGFEEGTFTAGNYTEQYDPNTPSMVSQSYDNGAFKFGIDGVELEFATTTNQYQFSGTAGSNLLRDENDQTSFLFYTASYHSQDGWQFSIMADHFPDMEVPVAKAELKLDNLNASVSESYFAIEIDARLSMDDVMGDDFELALNGLSLGTNGVSVDQVETSGNHNLDLFNQEDNLRITNWEISLESSQGNSQSNLMANYHLFLSLDGSLHFIDEDFNFTGLKFGTDGSLSLEGASSSNLLASEQQILGEYLILTSLNITTLEQKIALKAGGEVNLPAPLKQEQDDNKMDITVNYKGDVAVTLPPIGEDDIPPVEFGDVATIEVTEAKVLLDPINLENTVFFVSVDLRIKSDDEEDKLIQFGKDNNNPNDAGFVYQYNEGLAIRVTNAPDFTFEESFFNLTIDNVEASYVNQKFEVKFDAKAGFNLPKVTSSATMAGNIINNDGFTLGRFAGGEFSITDYVKLTIGNFKYAENEYVKLLKPAKGTEGTNDADTAMVEVYMEKYLEFSSYGDGKALEISINSGSEGEGDSGGALISGSIKKILFYTNSTETVFHMQELEIGVSEQAKLLADFEYRKDNTGFLVRVAGRAQITTGSDDIFLAAVGKLATINNKFSMGIVVAASAPVPIIPGIIEMTALGGGFFINPEQEDFRLITKSLAYDPMEKPWEANDFDGSKFNIIVYGGVGMMGSAGQYMMNGETLLMIASNFMMIDVSVSMKATPVKGQANFTAKWSKNKYSLYAGGNLRFIDDIKPVVSGALGIEFKIVKVKNRDLVWAITGGTDAASGEKIEIVSIVKAECNILVNSNGFIAGASIGVNEDIGLISFNGKMETDIWYNRIEQENADATISVKQNAGAYATISVKGEVLGGLGSIEGIAKGALIVEKDDYLIYASLTGRVEVFAVFNGSKTIWASISSEGYDGGTGKSGYEDYIAKMANLSEELNKKAEEMLAELDAADNTIAVLSDETLTQAGITLFMADQQSREQWRALFLNNESKIMNPVPQELIDMMDNIVYNDRPADNIKADQYLQLMKSYSSDIKKYISDILVQIRELKTSAEAWKIQSDQLIEEVNNPINNIDQEWSGDQAPSYKIDVAMAEENVENLRELKTNIGQLNKEAFTNAIEKTIENINKIESKMGGTSFTFFEPTGSVTLGQGELLVADQDGVSINTMASVYELAYSNTRKFYANQVNYFSSLGRWAENKQQWYDNNEYIGSDVEMANKKIVRNNYGLEYKTTNSFTKWDKIMNDNTSDNIEITGDLFDIPFGEVELSNAEFIANRRYYIEKLNPSISDAEAMKNADDFENKVINKFNSKRKKEFIASVHESMSDIYDMQSLGIEAIKNTSFSKADSLKQASQGILNSLETAHASFTRKQDEIHLIRNAMLNNLYNMYQMYKEWTNSEDESEEIDENLSQLETQLLPPKIENITLSQNINDSDNLVNFNFSIDHAYINNNPNYLNILTSKSYPNIGLIQNSYTIKGSATSVRDDFRGISGKLNPSINYALFNDPNKQQESITIFIRSRGPGGSSVTRRTQTDVDYKNNDGAGNIVSQPRSIMVEDNSAPSTPMISFPKVRSNNGTYWFNTASDLTVKVLSIDNESDIAAIEYAIGSAKGGTDIRNWTTTPAASAWNKHGSSMENWTKIFRIVDANFQPGKDYYISVRVTNGAGMKSGIKSVSKPVRLELQMPEFEQQNEMILPDFALNSTNILMQSNNSLTIPKMESPLNVNDSKKLPNTLLANWPVANDNLSGLYQYLCIVSEQAAASSDTSAALVYGFIEADKQRKFYVKGIHLDFEDEVYLHVFAEDYAGNLSDPITYDLIAKDPTRPTLPKVTTRSNPENIRLYVIKPSYDLETGIAGIEYAIGDSPHNTNIQMWKTNYYDGNNESSSADNLLAPGISQTIYQHKLEDNQWLNGLIKIWTNDVIDGETIFSYTDAPYYELSTANLPAGKPIYIKYRTINGQGMKSNTVTVGPAFVDNTAPPSPNVSLRSNTAVEDELIISLSNIRDDESGIAKIEYQLKYEHHSPSHASWKDFNQQTTIQMSPYSASKNIAVKKMYNENVSISLNGSSNNTNNPVNPVTQIGIRLTNGVGLQSVFWFDETQFSNITKAQKVLEDKDFGFDINW